MKPANTCAYEPTLPSAANTTISHTMTAARKRIISTIMNPITATCTQFFRSHCYTRLNQWELF